MSALDALSVRQRRFVEGVASGLSDVDAYVAAGYKARGGTARSGASTLRTKANIRSALAEIQSTSADIADRAERQQFWSQTMRDPNQCIRARLKASELLGKAGADFTERHLHAQMTPNQAAAALAAAYEGGSDS